MTAVDPTTNEQIKSMQVDIAGLRARLAWQRRKSLYLGSALLLALSLMLPRVLVLWTIRRDDPVASLSLWDVLSMVSGEVPGNQAGDSEAALSSLRLGTAALTLSVIVLVVASVLSLMVGASTLMYESVDAPVSKSRRLALRSCAGMLVAGNLLFLAGCWSYGYFSRVFDGWQPGLLLSLAGAVCVFRMSLD